MDGEQSLGGELWEFAELREVGEALIKVAQSLAVQGELIKKILPAVAERAEDASPLADTLERLAAANRENQVLLRQIVGGVERIKCGFKSAKKRFVPTEPWYPPIGRRLG
jgi:hypothetical protein